jgi:hypothetical protein
MLKTAISLFVIAQRLKKVWSGRPGSNRRRPAWEAGILPLNYARPDGVGAVELYGISAGLSTSLV